MRTSLSVPLTAALLSLAAPAQSPVPFPFQLVQAQPTELLLAPSLAGFDDLASRTAVRLTGVPVPGGGVVDLDLRRISLHLAPGAIHVDGVSTAGPVDPRLSLWGGRLAGNPDSDAFLAFSSTGAHGWFGPHGDLVHMVADPGPGNDWSNARTRLVPESAVAAGRPSFDGCTVISPPGQPTATVHTGPSAANAGNTLYEAKVGFETDYEFYALFNNLTAAQNYALVVIGAVASRYQEQCDAVFTLPYVGFHTANNDPWSASDCSGRLNEFRRAWDRGAAPAYAHVYHMISGVRLSGCGGVAYLGVLCNRNYGFGLSGHYNTNFTWPNPSRSVTWDFMVMAHELGHNFGAPHTHDYSPPIDTCASGGCISNGTIMSYCHTCAGGMNNIDIRFHPRVAATIQATVAQSCMQPFEGMTTEDLHYGRPGSNGRPVQDLSYANARVVVDVSSAPLSQPGVVFFGFTQQNQQFLGWWLVPSPDLAIPLAADAAGDASYSFPVQPSFPMGVELYAHSWFLDPSGFLPYSISNATRALLIKP